MQAEELKYLSHEAVIKKVAPLATLDNVTSGIPAAITLAQIIKDGGYATAPDYVEVLCAIIERYNLTQYNVAQPPFLVRVTVPMVAARKGPGSEYPATVVVRGPNVFTITEVQGSYGRLKSGAGWLNLHYAEWLCSE